ncbi:Spc98 family-domain-containing protein [Dactylonectria estremocensis]|uniref:Spindle pole body component n=1 Tax=Dactylonectria estremocensis TaxID=1079267 RepID=A0A9P9JAH1_9HYPO|nr:Spc98 family-domain-containing protein [Dactylonectria estremocensis]
MAFAARLGALTGELVEAVTLTSAQTRPDRFNAHREAALRNLKSHPFLRTNQFDVEHNLDGLEERFRVNLREELADALHERRGLLQQTPSQWHPEILYLLLELSDQPTFNTRLSDLDLLKKGSGEQEEEQLRWEDIAREDGWDQDDAIWKTIKYSDSSDDGDGEGYREESGSESGTSIASSEVPPRRTAEDLVIHPEDNPQLTLIRKAQEWRTGKPPKDGAGHTRKVPITEFHIAREVLFMLQGLDTTLFAPDGSADPAFQMTHTAWDTYKALISYFSEAGRRLAVLRRFIAQPQRSSHLQAFHDSVAARLHCFDKMVTKIQAPLVSPKHDFVVSLLRIKAELTAGLEPLFALSGIVTQMQDGSSSGAFRYLELLFEGSNIAQLAGKPATYEFLARIFVECFDVYLRPIRLWMDEGKLLPGDKIFFASEFPTQVPLGKIWKDQYRLRRTVDGKLHAPKFLQPAANKIFNTGKNVVVLKKLGRFESTRSKWSVEEPPLDYDAICPAGFELAPFCDLFDAAFDRWLQSKYNTTSTILRNALFEHCGLWSALDAMGHLYFMSDGSASELFSRNLFSKLDLLASSWHNRYGLTGTAQEAFASLIDAVRLSVTVSPEGLRVPALAARDSIRTALPTVMVNYRLSWPVQMIISDNTISQYQSIFTLLLQLRRALYVLQKQRILDRYWTDDDNWYERSLYYSMRTRLLWFSTSLQSYLATLVLAPNSARMRQELQDAHDVDAMIAIHATCMKRVIDEACLGNRLTLIRECFLDILDLAIKLEQAQVLHDKEAEELRELSRLSAMSSPGPPGTPRPPRTPKYIRDGDEDSDNESDEEKKPSRVKPGKPYTTVLREIKADFERHLRFICEGLRSVARATSDAQSAKWDILAEMLQSGSRT